MPKVPVFVGASFKYSQALPFVKRNRSFDLKHPLTRYCGCLMEAQNTPMSVRLFLNLKEISGFRIPESTTYLGFELLNQVSSITTILRQRISLLQTIRTGALRTLQK